YFGLLAETASSRNGGAWSTTEQADPYLIVADVERVVHGARPAGAAFHVRTFNVPRSRLWLRRPRGLNFCGRAEKNLERGTCERGTLNVRTWNAVSYTFFKKFRRAQN